MDQTNNDDRRDSFRVNMAAMVSIHSVNDDLIDPSDCFPELHAMALLSASNNIEQEIVSLTDRIKDLATKKTIQLLHQKMSLMAKLIDVKAAQDNELTSQNIDISEGGCSVFLNEELQPGQKLAIALIFTPAYFALFSFANIAEACAEDKGFRYHLAFENLPEVQRQQLLKHMFKAQTDKSKP